MTTEPTTGNAAEPNPPSSAKKGLPWKGLLGVGMVAAVLWLAAYIEHRGGIVELLKLPPAVYASSPDAQDGYTIMAAVRGRAGHDFRYRPSTGQTEPQSDNYDGEFDNVNDLCAPVDGVAGVWISTPRMPSNGPDYLDPITSYVPHRPPPFYVSERVSTGQRYPAAWMFFPKANPQMLFVAIPGGYPDSVRWVDIVVSDPANRVAEWRIGRLPASKRVIPDHPRVQDHIAFRGATVRAVAIRAWGGGIRVERLPQVPVSGYRQWQIQYGDPYADWQPYGAAASGKLNQTAILTDPGGIDDFNSRSDRFRSAFITTPFASFDRYARQPGCLTELDTFSETVCFRHIPIRNDRQDRPGFQWHQFVLDHPVSLTTPSGVTVTLPPQGHDDPVPGAQTVDLKLAVTPQVWTNTDAASIESPSERKVDLPLSPLAAKYHRPMSLAVHFSLSPSARNGSPSQVPPTRFTVDYFKTSSMWTQPISSQIRLILTPKMSMPDDWRLDKRLDKSPFVDLNVTVVQRVDIASCPFTLTVPLRDPTAADRQVNSPWTVLIK